MKTKFLYLILVLSVLQLNVISQCSVSLTPIAAWGGPGTYTIGVNGFIGPFQLCPNVIVYDTMGSNSRTYYCHAGSTLYLKNGFGHNVHLKGGSVLNIVGGGPGSIDVYKEINAAVNGSVSPVTTTCAAVAFPTIACPAPTVTGLNEFEDLEVLSVYPNPANTEFSIQNNKDELLNVTMINALGENVKYFQIEEKLSINLGDLNEGIYFLMIDDRKGIRKLKRLLIVR